MKSNEHEIMSDETALQYAIETLEEIQQSFEESFHLSLEEVDDEERAELSLVIQTLSSMLTSYADCSFNFLTLDDMEEEDAQA